LKSGGKYGNHATIHQKTKEISMTRMKPTFMTIGVCVLLALFVLKPALAADWWNSKQESRPTDRIDVTDSEIPHQPAQASRVNWEDGYIEVKAGATADTRDTVNLGPWLLRGPEDRTASGLRKDGGNGCRHQPDR
jgi:hypothetical protein